MKLTRIAGLWSTRWREPSTCEACGGARYTPETLAVKFRGRTIADVLAMTVEAALELFAEVPKIRRVLQTLHDVGLGYIPLGQAALWVAVAAAIVSAADYFRRFNLFVGPSPADLRPPGERRATDRKVG